MAKVILYGGVTYNAFGVDEASNGESFVKDLADLGVGDYDWNGETKMLANFSGSVAASNFDSAFENLNRFQVYKTIGESDKLYKVYEGESAEEQVFEDFAVGDLCDYKYYVNAVGGTETYVDIPTTDENGKVTTESVKVNIETITPFVSKTIRKHDGIISVIGLIQDEDDLNTYRIDTDNIWQLSLNVTNNGYTLNTDKTFYNTLDAYGKASGGNRKQRSVPIEGLLGRIECPVAEYSDTYDNIVDWETFAASSNMKMLIDLRGVITLGDIDTNPSFKYEETPNHEVSVSFTFTQTADLSNCNVLAQVLVHNPIYWEYLAENEGLYLKSDETKGGKQTVPEGEADSNYFVVPTDEVA